jgi:hypothetical protein
MSVRSLIPLSLLLLGAPALAQQILVVDGKNRPGAQFTDLPAAEAAASDGDVIQLLSDGGVYTAIQTTKALTVTGSVGQALIRVAPGQPFQVTGIPANRSFSLKSCLLALGSGSGPVIRIANCQGRVHLDQLEISGGQPGIDVALSQLTIKESRVLGATPALAALGSMLALSGTVLQGSAGDSRFAMNASEAMVLDTCTSVSVAGGQVIGGLGDALLPAAPAIRLRLTVLDLATGGASCSVRAGPPRQGTAPVPAVAGQSSLVRLDPLVTVTSTNGAPLFQGVQVTTAQFPSLSGYGIGSLHLYHQSVPGAAEVMLHGLSGGPISAANVTSALWIDPRLLLAAPGVPATLWLEYVPYGLTVVAQVLSASSSGFELSNPVAITVR